MESQESTTLSESDERVYERHYRTPSPVLPGHTSGRPGSPGARDVAQEEGPKWDVRGFNRPGGAMWTDPFTPYRAGEALKYQDESYSAYSTAQKDHPGSRSTTLNSQAETQRSARALFKERLRLRQRVRAHATGARPLCRARRPKLLLPSMAGGAPPDDTYMTLTRTDPSACVFNPWPQALLAQKESAWDSSTYKICPSSLRGMRPGTREPWARDALFYQRKTGSFETVAGAHAREAYNDESALDSNNGYRSQVTATGLKKNASLGGQPLWDSSTRRYCPPNLKGVHPVTREPWCVDEAFYNRNTTRDTTMDERAGGGALDLGSISHATRARARQVDREGFYMPNWEKWAAALSA